MMQNELRNDDGTAENVGDQDGPEVSEVDDTGMEVEINQKVTSSTPTSKLNGGITHVKEYVAKGRIEKSRKKASQYVVRGKSDKKWGRKVNRNGYESYDCNFCGKNFVLNSLLAKHLQRVHSNQIDETEEKEDEKLPDQVQDDKKTDYSSNDEELPTLFGPFPTQDDRIKPTKSCGKEKETVHYESDLEDQEQESTISPTGITEQVLVLDQPQPTIIENGINSNVEEVDVKEITNSCSFCPKAFKDEGILIKHLLSIHSTQTKKLNTCKVCKKIFVSNSQLLDHSKEHVSPTPRVKVKPQKQQQQQQQPLKQQRLSISKAVPVVPVPYPIHNKMNGIYQQPKPEMKLESNENNKIEAYLSKPLISEELPKDQFENEKAVDEIEIEVQVEEIFYSCSFCPRSFKDEVVLKKHLFSIHQTQTKKLICKFCKKFFIQTSLLLDHLKEHSPSKVKPQASPKPKHPKFKVQQPKFNNKGSFENYNKMNGIYKEINEEPETISTPKVESNVNKIKPLRISLTRMSEEFIRNETEIKIEKAVVEEKEIITEEIFTVEEEIVTVEEEIVPEISHSCSFCPRSFKDDDLLLRHLFSIHQRQVKNLTCKVCKMVFGNNSLFLDHSKEHSSTPAVPVKQKIPKLKLKIQRQPKSESIALTPTSIKIDNENNQEKVNECETEKEKGVPLIATNVNAEESLSVLEICEQFLKQPTEAEIPTDCNVEETHSCSFCSRIFKEKKNLDRHILSIHRPKPKMKKQKFKTCVCKMKIPKSQFLDHFLKEHTKKQDLNTQQQETSKESFPIHDELKKERDMDDCESSGIENSENDLRISEQLLIQPTDIEIGSNVEVGEIVYFDEMSHSCPYCSRKFKEKVNLVRHISSIHRPGRKVNYQHNCKICKKKFTDKSQFLDHSKEHSRVRQRQEIRVKDAFPKSVSKENEVSTTSEQLFQPAEIEVGSNVELELGEIVDIGEVFHPCSFCSRTFKDKEKLERHLLSIHQRLMKKQHTCKICKKVFIYHNQLTEHMRVHSPIKCKICQMRFSTKEDLNSHQNQEHSLSTIKIKELLETQEEKELFKLEKKLKLQQSIDNGRGRPRLDPTIKLLKMKYKQKMDRSKLDPSVKGMRYKYTPSSSKLKEPLVCTICSKSLWFQSNYDRHLQRHEKNQDHHKYIPSSNKLKEPIVCKICSKSLWFQSNYERHLLRHEKKGEDASMFIKKKKYNKKKMVVNDLDQVVRLSSGELDTIIKEKKYNKKKSVGNNLDQVVRLSSGELYTIKDELRVELDRIDGPPPPKRKKELELDSSAASSTNVSRRSSFVRTSRPRLTSHLTEIGINDAVDKLKAQILKHHQNQNHQLNRHNKKILFPKVLSSNKFKMIRSRNSESGGSISVSNCSNSNYDSESNDYDHISYISDYDYDDENEFPQDDQDSTDFDEFDDYCYDDDEDMENHPDSGDSGDGDGKVKVMELKDYYDTGSPAYTTDYSSALFQVNSFLFAEEQKKKKNCSIIPFEMY